MLNLFRWYRPMVSEKKLSYTHVSKNFPKINLIIEVSKSLPVDEIPDSPTWAPRSVLRGNGPNRTPCGGRWGWRRRCGDFYGCLRMIYTLLKKKCIDMMSLIYIYIIIYIYMYIYVIIYICMILYDPLYIHMIIQYILLNIYIYM